MKQPGIFNVVFLLVCVLSVRDGRSQDYPRWSLPEGALARLGKSSIGGGALSPDGTRLAVASTIGIWLYDVHTSAEVALFTGHTGSVNSVAFSPDGTLLASGSDGRGFDITVVVWEGRPAQKSMACGSVSDRSSLIKNGQQPIQVTHPAFGQRGSVEPDGKLPGRRAVEPEGPDDLSQVEGGDVAVVVHGVEGAAAEGAEGAAGQGDAVGVGGDSS